MRISSIDRSFFICCSAIAAKIIPKHVEFDVIFNLVKSYLVQNLVSKGFITFNTSTDSFFLKRGKLDSSDIDWFYNKWDIFIPEAPKSSKCFTGLEHKELHAFILNTILDEEIKIHTDATDKLTADGTLHCVNPTEEGNVLIFRRINKQKLQEGEKLLMHQKERPDNVLECTVVGNEIDYELCEVLLSVLVKDNNTSWELGSQYTLKAKLDMKSFQRQRQGIKEFAKLETPLATALRSKQCSSYDVKMNVPRLELEFVTEMLKQSELNEEQSEAVFYMLNHKLALLQGPPGTGKTVLSAMYLALLLVMNKRVLATASTNGAVDNLILKTIGFLKSEDFQVALRQVARRFKGQLLIIEDCDQLLKRILRFHSSRHPIQKDLVNFSHKLKLDTIKTFRGEQFNKHEATQLMLRTHNTIFCTANYAAHAAMVGAKVSLDCIFIDEGGQLVETELVAVAQLPVEQMVIIGDHRQHRTELKSSTAKDKGLDFSCLEIFEANEATLYALKKQYRMPKEISDLVTQIGRYKTLVPMLSDDKLLPTFRIVSDVETIPQNWNLRNFFNVDRLHYLHLDSSESSEEKSSTNFGQSVRNKQTHNHFQLMILRVLICFLSVGYDPETISIMCFYNAQKGEITRTWLKWRSLILSEQTSKEKMQSKMNNNNLKCVPTFQVSDVDNIGTTEDFF